MVLEPDDRPPLARVELALDQHVADQANISGHRVQRKDAGTGLLAPRAVTVVAAEQLVAAADGEQDRAAGHGLGQRRAAAGEIGCDEGLLAVLPAADVEEIRVGRRRVAEADLTDVEVDPAPQRPAREHREIAPIGVDVEVLGIQVRQDDLHATRSQYGRA